MQNDVVTAGRSRTKWGGVLAVVAFAMGAQLPHQPAAAVTLTNNDKKTYKIDVVRKGSPESHELAPGKVIARFCSTGCVIRLNGSANDEYELEGTERVSIEGGLVYYDGEEITKADDKAAEPDK